MPTGWLMALSFSTALLLAAGLTPPARCLGERAGWFRFPTPRHIHTRPTARSG